MATAEPDRSARFRRRVCSCVLVGLLLSCNRESYREAADEEVRQLIAEKSTDPRWSLNDFGIEIDPRSRYFDSSDPSSPPMPPDDPASHELMIVMDGKKGYAHWDEHGSVEQLENPDWRRIVDEEFPRTADGKIRLRLEDALELALRNSPDYQRQMETIYLSALDVSTERFRFDVQFFGGFTAGAQHRGSENAGGESNTAAVDSDASISKGFAAAGELLVSFANSIGWEFFGPTDGFTMSQLSFSFIQPLLRGGGRAVALEQLTIAERTLLANLRAYQRYRQGFYTDVAIGESGVSGAQRRGSS